MTIPDSVTFIWSGAFSTCTSLTSATIGNRVAQIGDYPFAGCIKLTSVTIPDSVTSMGVGAFEGCTSLTNVTIGNGLTSIGSSMFSGCTGLTSVTIGNGVTSIGNSVFSSCSKLASVTIGNGVTSIGSSVFSSCRSLTSITVDSANSFYMSDDGVLFDRNQTTLIQYPASKAGNYTIPSNVPNIGSFAFQYSTGLTSVIIPNSVTSIGVGAFSSCTSLPSVTIPSSVPSIGDNVFSGCTSLTSMTIPSSVTSIGGYAFQLCSGLTSVTIPGSVTTIGPNVFEGCTSLTNVTIGNGLTRIGSSMFSDCTSLTSMTIPNSLTSIGDSGFSGCIKLASIYFKGNAPYLGLSALLTSTNTLVYYVVGAIGWTSPFGGLNTVALGPPIVTEPLSAINTNVGQNVAFGVAAVSSVPLALSYQWTRNGITIAGASGAELSLNNVQSTDVGNYKVVVTNEYGSVSSMAALTLTQGNLYTQAQFDAALQVGFDLGLQVNDSDVLAAPNTYDLYTLSQVQALNVGTPLLAKDQVSGKFKLTIAAKKSADLSIYTVLPFSAGDATINAQGEMEFQFTSPDNAAFFRLESK